jgi:hypothetical protein
MSSREDLNPALGKSYGGPNSLAIPHRGGLSGPEAIAAASWAAQALLDTLRRGQSNFSSQPTDKHKKGD